MDFSEFRETLHRLLRLTPEQMRDAGAMDQGTEGHENDDWNLFRDSPLQWLFKTPGHRAERIWPLIAPAEVAEEDRMVPRRSPNIVTSTGMEELLKAAATLSSASEIIRGWDLAAIDPYVFVPGEYLTRDGRRAVVLRDDIGGDLNPHRLVGYVLESVNLTAFPYAWSPSGYPYAGHENLRLMPPPKAEPSEYDRGWNEALDAACADLGAWISKPIDPRSATQVVRALKRTGQ